MYLIVGAAGRLGRATTEALLDDHRPVRLLVRDPAKVADLAGLGAEVVRGDITDAATLARACDGVARVLTVVHAFEKGPVELHAVEHTGNRALIDAARAAGVQHFVFTSVFGAAPDHPIDFVRLKFATEQYLEASGLSWTILRPTAFMDFWAAQVGDPVLSTGRTTIFGRGENPLNFVAVRDVARFAVLALEDPRARGRVLEIGGPENLTMHQVVEVFERRLGRPATVKHVPLPVMRALAVLLRPLKPGLARQVAMGVLMDTAPMALDPTELLRTFPVPLTPLEELVRATRPAATARVS